MYQIIATARKELLILRRDTGALATLFLMPMIFILVMSLAFSNLDPSIRGAPPVLLVVNEDIGALGAQVTSTLTEQYDGPLVITDGTAPLTQARAEAMLQSGQATAAVLIPPNFSAQVTAAASGGTTTVTFLFDPNLAQQPHDALRGVLEGGIRQVIAPSITVVDRPLVGAAAAQANNAVARNVPAYTLFGVFFIVQYLAASILDERRLGTLRRVLAAPVRGPSFMAGKLLGALLINLTQIASMFAAGVLLLPLFGVPALDLSVNPVGLVLVSLVTSLTAGGLGLLLATVTRSYEQISGLGLMIVLPSAVLGGVMVPREQLPSLMRTLGLFSPHTWALDAYEDLLLHEGTLSTSLPAIAILCVFAAVFYGLAMIVFRYSVRASA